MPPKIPVPELLPAAALPAKSFLFQRFSATEVDITVNGADGHVYHAFFDGTWKGYEDLTPTA